MSMLSGVYVHNEIYSIRKNYNVLAHIFVISFSIIIIRITTCHTKCNWFSKVKNHHDN